MTAASPGPERNMGMNGRYPGIDRISAPDNRGRRSINGDRNPWSYFSSKRSSMKVKYDRALPVASRLLLSHPWNLDETEMLNLALGSWEQSKSV